MESGFVNSADIPMSYVAFRSDFAIVRWTSKDETPDSAARITKMSLTVSDLLSSLIIILNVGVRGWIDDGKNFIVACPSLQAASPTVDCTLHVMGSEGVQVNVTGTIPGLPKTETISSALLVRITVQGDYPITQLLVVTTSDVVSIFVENQAQGGPSLCLAIPLSADLTQPFTESPIETFLMSFPITSPEMNIFIVGSAYASTLVTLTVKSTGAFIYNTVTYNDGGTLVVTLQAGEVLEIITEQDLTGTHVEATKPVGVFTGTKVQPTLEQLPLLSQWGNPIALPFLDLCNSITVRTLVSQDTTTITLQRNSGDLVEVRNRGEYYDHENNETIVVDATASLVGIRCTIGSGDHPFAMILPPVSGLGTEFKCLTLSGFNNTAYMISTVPTDTYYNVSDIDTLFTKVHTHSGTGASTVRANVPDGYVIIKSKNSSPMEPYIAGFKSDGAYGYACAKGTMGSLLPDSLNSLVDVPVGVYTPIPALVSSTSAADSSSDVDMASTTEPISSSRTSVYMTMTVSSEQMPESSTFSVAQSSSEDVVTSTDLSNDINIASTTEVHSPSPSSNYMTMTSPSEQTPESNILSVAPTSSGDAVTSTDLSVVTSASIVPSSTIYTTSSTADPSTSETFTALSTVAFPPPEATSQMQELCFCRCGEDVILPNETKAFLEKFDIEIKRNLTLDSKTLSAYIRSKTSAEDDRPSAQNIGYFGIIIICVTGCLLVFADVLNLFKNGSPKRKKA